MVWCAGKSGDGFGSVLMNYVPGSMGTPEYEPENSAGSQFGRRKFKGRSIMQNTVPTGIFSGFPGSTRGKLENSRNYSIRKSKTFGRKPQSRGGSTVRYLTLTANCEGCLHIVYRPICWGPHF